MVDGTTVSGLWRYPVKSMLGEPLETSTVGDRGLAGDRAYALIDTETGHIASAKNPRRWEALFSCRAAYLEDPSERADDVPPAEITLPDGSVIRTDAGDVNDVLSRVVGRDVRLERQAPPEPTLEEYWPEVEGVAEDSRGTVTSERIALLAPAGTFFDGAAVHIVTTSTLAALAAAYPGGQFDARRFRPNLVVDTAESGFAENAWVDGTVAVGDDLEMLAVLAVPRCVMTTLAQDGLPADKKILQTVARENRIDIPGLGPSSCVGIYGFVTQPGVVSTGDSIVVRPKAASAPA